MTTRWIVDTDGREGFRVAEQDAGRVEFVTDRLPLEKCERAIVRLRERDAKRLHQTRQEAGRRLARRNQNGDDMTPLIDMIEQAFIEGRDSWVTDDSIDLAPMLLGLAVRGYDNDDTRGMIEASITDALLEMRAKWGNAWSALPGECAEAICRHLHVKGRESSVFRLRTGGGIA